MKGGLLQQLKNACIIGQQESGLQQGLCDYLVVPTRCCQKST